MSDATLIGGVVTLLGLIGSGIAWLVRRRDSKKDPIPKESAAVALAQSGVALMQGVADRLEARISGLEDDLAQARLDGAAARAEDRTEIDGLRGDVQHLRLTLSAAARYIERLLRWAKSDTRPPIPPLPSDLRDLIDPSLHD